MRIFKIFAIVSLLILTNGCGLFQNSNELSFGHCDKELFEKVKKDGSIRIIAEYDMEYIPEDQLSEEERQEQRKAVQVMHEQFLASMEGQQISGINESMYRPWIAMGVDEKALIFLCNSKLVKLVRLERVFQTY